MVPGQAVWRQARLYGARPSCLPHALDCLPLQNTQKDREKESEADTDLEREAEIKRERER